MITAAAATTSTSSSSSNQGGGGGAFTTLAQRVTFEKEIKKSKFIAIAGPVYNEQAANAFLSEVLFILFFRFSLVEFEF